MATGTEGALPSEAIDACRLAAPAELEPDVGRIRVVDDDETIRMLFGPPSSS